MAVRTAYTGLESVGDVLTASNFDKLPGGWIGYAEITASSSNVGNTITDVTGLSVTVTVNTSRRIQISVQSQIAVDTNNETMELSIRESSTQLQRAPMTVTALVAPQGLTADVVLTPSSGAHTYKVSLQRTSGSGNCSISAGATFPTYILVQDLGPAA